MNSSEEAEGFIETPSGEADKGDATDERDDRVADGTRRAFWREIEEHVQERVGHEGADSEAEDIHDREKRHVSSEVVEPKHKRD